MTYRHTHASTRDGSPAMLLDTNLDGTLILMNEDGDVWTDPADRWEEIDPTPCCPAHGSNLGPDCDFPGYAENH